MLYSGTDPGSCLTEFTLVYEDNRQKGGSHAYDNAMVRSIMPLCVSRSVLRLCTKRVNRFTDFLTRLGTPMYPHLLIGQQTKTVVVMPTGVPRS